MKGYELIIPPTLIVNEDCQVEPIQISLHKINAKSFMSEIRTVFPNADWQKGEVIVISTMQHALMDLVQFGDDVEKEKERLLENFVRLASTVCKEITQLGHFADFIDPCSGLPMNSDSNQLFSEVQCAQLVLAYKVMNAGCCKILLHPDWGSAVYPATIVTNASETAVQSVFYRIAPTIMRIS